VALYVPAPLGLFSLDLMSERQPFDTPDIPDAERLTARARIADWATAAIRWEARAGFDRWRAARSFGTVGAAGRFERGRVSIGIDADAWLGTGAFGTATVSGGWRSARVRRGFVLDLSSAGQTIAARAPLDLWPAGDTGHARRTLLRAHPVLDDGRLRVDRLGRHLAQVSAEAQHWWHASGAVPIGAAIFVDAARLAGRPLANARNLTDVDTGAGFRLALPGRTGFLRADFAHGLRDGRNAVSVSWTP
jgi:hypothetical protein